MATCTRPGLGRLPELVRSWLHAEETTKAKSSLNLLSKLNFHLEQEKFLKALGVFKGTEGPLAPTREGGVPTPTALLQGCPKVSVRCLVCQLKWRCQWAAIHGLEPPARGPTVQHAGQLLVLTLEGAVLLHRNRNTNVNIFF